MPVLTHRWQTTTRRHVDTQRLRTSAPFEMSEQLLKIAVPYSSLTTPPWKARRQHNDQFHDEDASRASIARSGHVVKGGMVTTHQ